jgi:hypothetical protein
MHNSVVETMSRSPRWMSNQSQSCQSPMAAKFETHDIEPWSVQIHLRVMPIEHHNKIYLLIECGERFQYNLEAEDKRPCLNWLNCVSLPQIDSLLCNMAGLVGKWRCLSFLPPQRIKLIYQSSKHNTNYIVTRKLKGTWNTYVQYISSFHRDQTHMQEN